MDECNGDIGCFSGAAIEVFCRVFCGRLCLWGASGWLLLGRWGGPRLFPLRWLHPRIDGRNTFLNLLLVGVLLSYTTLFVLDIMFYLWRVKPPLKLDISPKYSMINIAGGSFSKTAKWHPYNSAQKLKITF